MIGTSRTRFCFAVFFAVVSQQLSARQTSGTPPEPAPAQKPDTAPEPPKKGLEFRIGESTLKVGGYVKLNLIHDFDRIGSTDSFDPRTIDTSGLDGENTRMHARDTRVNLDLRTPTDIGELKTYIEGDFFGDGNAFRLRHAYGQIDHLLAGQTWTTFMDEDAMPTTLDFESPTAFPLIRQAQVRYTQKFEGGGYAAVSLEDPNNDLVSPPGVPGVEESPIPDINARVRLENERGHVQLGLWGGMTKFQPDAGASDNVELWGVNLATKERTWGDDYAILQLTYGDGVGRYRGGVTAAPDSDGNLEAVRLSAWMGAYMHSWSPKYRSTVTYSAGRGDLPGGAPADANEAVTYLATNLIWQYCDRAWVGIEYLHGTLDEFDGDDGAADRVQLSWRFDL